MDLQNRTRPCNNNSPEYEPKKLHFNNKSSVKLVKMKLQGLERGVPGALEPLNFCCAAWSPDDFDAWIREYLITVKPGAPNEMLWSPGAPIFLSWSPGAPHILDRSPGALNPFGTLSTAVKRLLQFFRFISPVREISFTMARVYHDGC